MRSLLFRVVMEGQFGVGLVVNAALYIPQAFRVFKEKASRELSTIMFIGFWLLTLSQVIYGFYIRDWIMAWGNTLTLFTCGVVVCLIYIYRKN